MVERNVTRDVAPLGGMKHYVATQLCVGWIVKLYRGLEHRAEGAGKGSHHRYDRLFTFG